MSELTPRQLEVLAVAAKGLTDAAVAHELGIAENTVGNHISNALQTLDASSKIEAFLHLGWLRPPNTATDEAWGPTDG